MVASLLLCQVFGPPCCQPGFCNKPVLFSRSNWRAETAYQEDFGELVEQFSARNPPSSLNLAIVLLEKERERKSKKGKDNKPHRPTLSPVDRDDVNRASITLMN